MRKIRWIKPFDGLRDIGKIEENDSDLCAEWVANGHAEYVDDPPAPAKPEPDPEPEARQLEGSPVDRSMKGKAKTK